MTSSTIKRPEDLFKKIDSVHARATAVFNSLDPRSEELTASKKQTNKKPSVEVDSNNNVLGNKKIKLK